MTEAHERRHFWRAIFHAPVQLATHRSFTKARLLDISLKGALLEVGEAWMGQAGEECRLRLELSPEVVIVMLATITHRQGRQIGLRCVNIDLDSITHLRRLVELNAGDMRLLERELSNLLGDSDGN